MTHEPIQEMSRARMQRDDQMEGDGVTAGNRLRFSFRFSSAKKENSSTNQYRKDLGRGRREMIERKAIGFDQLGCIIITKQQKNRFNSCRICLAVVTTSGDISIAYRQMQ